MNYKEIFETSLKTTGMIVGAVGGTGSLIYLGFSPFMYYF